MNEKNHFVTGMTQKHSITLRTSGTDVTKKQISDILTLPGIGVSFDELSELYLEIFSHPSWNDWIYDKEKKYSISSKTFEVVRTMQQQGEKIIQEISGKNILYDFLLIKNKLAGFIYGWESTFSQLNIDKFHLSNDEFTHLESILFEQGFRPGDTMIYLSQLGLSESQRGKGYGKNLIENFISQAKEQKKSYLILRTSKKRALPYEYMLNHHKGIVMYEYEDYANNVIILLKL